MAPLIDTSLREHLLERFREYDRAAMFGDPWPTDPRDELTGIMDWTESPDTLAPFDTTRDRIAAALKLLVLYIEKHDIGNAEDHPLNIIADFLSQAEWSIDDARSLITNVQRKEVTPIT